MKEKNKRVCKSKHTYELCIIKSDEFMWYYAIDTVKWAFKKNVYNKHTLQ